MIANAAMPPPSIVRSVLFQHSLLLSILLLSIGSVAADDKLIPACTAYCEPAAEGATFSEKRGVSRWMTSNSLVWYGHFTEPGTIAVSIQVRLPVNESRSLSLRHASEVIPFRWTSSSAKSERIEIGQVIIDQPGYHRFAIEVTDRTPETGGRDEALIVESLLLDGPPVATSQFNLKERRNAASVHLSFPVARDTKVAWFYNEVTAIEDPLHTFYMACGFHRGYFGMQINSPTERRIIFSVWDAGNGSNADRRSEVDQKNHVVLLAKGEGVHANEFGGEGTGGHSHLVYDWKTGETQRFLVTAEPNEDKSTTYTGYYLHPDRRAWMLIAAMRAPEDGGYLRGLHGFSENFWGSNGHLRRKALFGSSWIRTSDHQWIELTSARFSHDATGKEDRLDRFMGTENGQFFLSHGGFIEGATPSGAMFERPAIGTHPSIEPVDLPTRTPNP